MRRCFPAFVFGTGDITEFGYVGNTWPFTEKLFRPMPCPVYLVPGDHDNTWTAMLPILGKQYDGDSYSFDKFSCHFACIDSATPQEPLPSLRSFAVVPVLVETAHGDEARRILAEGESLEEGAELLEGDDPDEVAAREDR